MPKWEWQARTGLVDLVDSAGRIALGMQTWLRAISGQGQREKERGAKEHEHQTVAPVTGWDEGWVDFRSALR